MKEEKRGNLRLWDDDDDDVIDVSISLFLSVWQAVSVLVLLSLSSLTHSFVHQWTSNRVEAQILWLVVLIHQKRKEFKIIMREFESGGREREEKTLSIINYVLQQNEFHGQKE
jgi:hypothetical protein